MFARIVSVRLKSNMLSDYTRIFEKEILPLLHKQKGFKDEIRLSNPSSLDVVAISMWENKATEQRARNVDNPEILKGHEGHYVHAKVTNAGLAR